MPDFPIKIAVKRDGPRGWHWIAAEHYDPKVHDLHDVEAEAPVEEPVAPPSEEPAEPESPPPTPDEKPAARAKKPRRKRKAG